MRQEYRKQGKGVRRGTGPAAALAALCGLLLAACGGTPADIGVATSGSGATAGEAPSEGAAAHAPGAEAWARATVAGDVELRLERGNALAGAMYGRYHLSFSGEPSGDAGPVIISLAREDTTSPGAGTYALGEAGDFDGNVEIHPGPADYAIESGELVVTSAEGDVLEGRYVLEAQERGGSARIRVEGGFRTQAVD